MIVVHAARTGDSAGSVGVRRKLLIGEMSVVGRGQKGKSADEGGIRQSVARADIDCVAGVEGMGYRGDYGHDVAGASEGGDIVARRQGNGIIEGLKRDDVAVHAL